ncbi:hypothetical protein WJU23_02530 [Prosthecobacter sp. SYSU 5D2]|uniref:hypothetical protein n=1 Tax=Prosthecobacter sp. SYSU 5D2 TaxID=3134134 RepID=UPI0031FEA9A0
MRYISTLMAMFSLACTQTQAEFHEEFHPWDVVNGSASVAELGVTKIEWVEVDRRLFYSNFKIYLFQSDAEIAESIGLLRRITKNSEAHSPRLDAYSEVGSVVLHGHEQEVTLPVKYAGQEKWWRFHHIHEGDYFSASVQKGKDEEGLIHAWFQNPAKLAHKRIYPSRWLFFVMVLVTTIWLLKLCVRTIRRMTRCSLKRAL